jgi:hypothetical protein
MSSTLSHESNIISVWFPTLLNPLEMNINEVLNLGCEKFFWFHISKAICVGFQDSSHNKLLLSGHFLPSIQMMSHLFNIKTSFGPLFWQNMGCTSTGK